MARPKKVIEGQESDLIDSKEKALALFEKGGFTKVEGVSIAYVCEDGNVFYDYPAARTWVEDVTVRNDGKRPQLFDIQI